MNFVASLPAQRDSVNGYTSTYTTRLNFAEMPRMYFRDQDPTGSESSLT